MAIFRRLYFNGDLGVPAQRPGSIGICDSQKLTIHNQHVLKENGDA